MAGAQNIHANSNYPRPQSILSPIRWGGRARGKGLREGGREEGREWVGAIAIISPMKKSAMYLNYHIPHLSS